MTREQEMVTVCSSCLRESCWQGIFYCEQYRTAGTVEIPREKEKK